MLDLSGEQQATSSEPMLDQIEQTGPLFCRVPDYNLSHNALEAMTQAKLSDCKPYVRAISAALASISQKQGHTGDAIGAYRRNTIGGNLYALKVTIHGKTQTDDSKVLIDVDLNMQYDLALAANEAFKAILRYQYMPRDNLPILPQYFTKAEKCCATKAADLTLEWVQMFRGSVEERLQAL